MQEKNDFPLSSIAQDIVNSAQLAYERGLKDGNINDDVLAAKLKEAYQNGYEKGLDDNAFSKEDCIKLLQMTGWMANHDKQMYEQGLQEAWEAVRRIVFAPKDGGLTSEQIEEIFGEYLSICGIFDQFGVHEVLEKLKAWDERDIITVGDEVEDGAGTKSVVMAVDEKQASLLSLDYEHVQLMPLDKLHKTGRHFDIEEILGKLRGEE